MIKIGEFLTEKEVNLAFLKGKLNLFGTRLQQVACLISEVVCFVFIFYSYSPSIIYLVILSCRDL